VIVDGMKGRWEKEKGEKEEKSEVVRWRRRSNG
jgi:hypothetical protein